MDIFTDILAITGVLMVKTINEMSPESKESTRKTDRLGMKVTV